MLILSDSKLAFSFLRKSCFLAIEDLNNQSFQQQLQLFSYGGF